MKSRFLFLLIILFCSINPQDKKEIFSISYNHSKAGKNKILSELKANLNYGLEISKGFMGFANFSFMNTNFSNNNFSPNIGINTGLLLPSQNSEQIFVIGIESSIDKKLFSDDFMKHSAFYKYTYFVNSELDLAAGLFYKKELFDDLIFPLLGGEIKFNESLSLQALLPINLKLEQKLNDKLSLGILSEWDINSVVYDEGYLRNEAIGMFVFLEFEFGKNIFLEATLGKNVFSDSYLFNKLDGIKEEVKQKEGVILRFNLSYKIN